MAEAAEISPATFYSYLPTREGVVLQGDLDVLTLDALEAQPAGLTRWPRCGAPWPPPGPGSPRKNGNSSGRPPS